LFLAAEGALIGCIYCVSENDSNLKQYIARNYKDQFWRYLADDISAKYHQNRYV